MEDNRLGTILKKYRWMLVLLIIVFAGIVGLMIYLNRDTEGEVVIGLAPSTARIKIGTVGYAPGKYKIEEGKYEVEVYAEGYESKKVEVNIVAGQANEIDEYLINKNSGIDYIYTDEKAAEVLIKIKDRLSESEKKVVEKYQAELEKSHKLLDERVTDYRGGITLMVGYYNGKAFYISDGSQFDGCDKKSQRSCLFINDYTGQGLDFIKNEINKKGYNSDLYQIFYFNRSGASR
jgi:hypothetical protein